MTSPDVEGLRFLRALEVVRSFVPDFQVREKADVWHQRLLGRLLRLLGNPDYMDSFWTTFGFTTYRPSGSRTSTAVLFHEGRHALDASILSRLLFALLYLFPIPLVIAFVAMAWSMSTLWMLVPIGLALAPWPAFFRARLEMRAYAVSAMCDHWTRGPAIAFGPERLSFYLRQFVTMNYYLMWPFKGSVSRWLQGVRYDAMTNGWVNDPYLEAIREFYKKEGMLAG